MSELKMCTKCKVEKGRSEFRERSGPKANRDGLNAVCRICERQAKAAYDAKKKQENPLRRCKACLEQKHFTLFMEHPGSVGTRCIKCYEEATQKKQIEAAKIAFECNVQHKDGKKRCSKCRLFIDVNLFWRSKHTVDGFYSSCITCTKLSQSKLAGRRLSTARKWRVKNKIRINSYSRKWDKHRRKTDPAYNLQRNVMHAIVASIRKYGFENLKTKRLDKAIFEHLPYTSDQLKTHIESLWESWMNWGNYGKYDAGRTTWQIDHIIPQSKLPFADMTEENFQKLWSLSNLRPLETIANIRKSNKVVS